MAEDIAMSSLRSHPNSNVSIGTLSQVSLRSEYSPCVRLCLGLGLPSCLRDVDDMIATWLGTGYDMASEGHARKCIRVLHFPFTSLGRLPPELSVSGHSES